MNPNTTNTTAPLGINSIVVCRLITGKPSTSAKLPEQHADILLRSGAADGAVRAPSARLFARGGAVSEAFATINGMSLYLRKKGNSVPDQPGTTYQLATGIDGIQKEYDERRDALDSQLATIRRDYDELIAAGRSSLGDLDREVAWPPVLDFLSQFRFELRWLGQPSAIGDSTLIGAVSRETAARVRAASQSAAAGMLTEAHGNLLRDACAEMADVIEKLTTGKRLRQERLDRLAEVAAELESKNWLQLPGLAATASQLRELHKVAASDLPTAAERRDHADKVGRAMHDANVTLASLGL